MYLLFLHDGWAKLHQLLLHRTNQRVGFGQLEQAVHETLPGTQISYGLIIIIDKTGLNVYA